MLHGPGVLREPVQDGKPFPPGVLDRVVAFVDEALRRGHPVLVQCAAGRSRSASAAYAILRALYGLSDAEALRRVETVHMGFRWPRRATLESARRWAWRRGLGIEPGTLR